jgi:2-polyprenyl-3-methyl-5-hydroxy-6-metoxy-1,4-benzoquinol methylase
MTTSPVDLDATRAKAQLLSSYLAGAVSTAMIHLGDALGLYAAMNGAGPLTSAELATRTGLSERWLREWMRQQCAALVLDYRGDERFELTAETALCVADEKSIFSVIGSFDSFPLQMQRLPDLKDSFHTGVGSSYDDRGAEGARAIERMLGPTHRTMLVPAFLPQLEEVVEKLRAGARVADVGCGGGLALIEMAKAFPASQFAGYDTSVHALVRATANAAEAGVTNVTFHEAIGDPLPAAPTFDLIVTFDCLHDMTHPEPVVAAIRQALKPDGTWFIADINGAATLEENLANPRSATMYGISILNCMAAGLSTTDGAGLGTLGLPEPAMKDLVAGAGFSRFRRVPINHPINAYYEARI